MKALFTLSVVVFSFLFIQNTSAQEAYFLSDPTLSPDAETIIYAYDGDLWKVSSRGGLAVRITAMDGEESLPRISPDGKWLAFTSSQFGNKDIYVMPLNGGAINQLTFHDASDEVDSWSWDSETIYFTSSRNNRYAGYQVSKIGGTPKALFSHYFNTTHNIAAQPKTEELFFNESWESKNFTHRKRYKGSYNPNIKSYNPKTKVYKEYTTYEGKDMWATFDQNGQLYFVSDEHTGEYNLFTFNNTTKIGLTSFKTSIGRPQASANGKAVVFEKDYQLYVYDVALKTTKKVDILMPINNTLNQNQDFKVSNTITHFDISPDGKKIAFVSRGTLFVSDNKGKFTRPIGTKTGERVLEAKWLKDNTTLLFTRTHQGYSNIFSIAAIGNDTEKQHTNEARNDVNIQLDTTNSKAVYISGRDELRLLDLKTYKSDVLVTDEFWALYAPQPRFSPDGTHIVYNAYRNFEHDVFVIRLADKKIMNLTQTGVTETEPVWSPDGKQLYFSSNLVKPSYPYGVPDAQIYKMPLDKFENPYQSEKYTALFKKDEPKAEEKKGTKKEKVATTAPSKISINPDEIMQRIESISPSFGIQESPFTIRTKEATHVYYLSNHDEGDSKLWKTVITPFEKNKIEKVSDEKIRNYQIAQSKDNYFLLANGSIHSLDIEKNKLEKIDIDHNFRKNLAEEFNQMFMEAWAGFEENFYDQDFHGEDWSALKEKYAHYLPYLTNRAQLRVLFNDMLGELNTSHFGFNSSGKEENEFYTSSFNAIGAIFSDENPFEITSIIHHGPLDITGKNIQKGDVLIAVNGEKVTSDKNREAYFVEASLDNEMELLFNRNGAAIKVNVHPISSNAQRTLLYDEWVANNQKYIDAKSDKKVAYIHMKNMSGGELENFKREMVSEANQREAIILDLRYNTGGNVHDEVLQFLSQKPYLQWKYRNGAMASQPNFAPAVKPIILLINEQSLSDAEMTAAGFKTLGLGKIIGVETYRWIVFTSSKGLVDGSSYRLPSWGCYTLDGDNLEKTGVAPDIQVSENFKDRLEGKQPQLDKALEEIFSQLGNN
ncbi:S41 family peptidase [Cellulophaga sp. Hel_I_12]|uniref:S41 family peptidase n=1 Tax=Cellulophaga sp. Hel_I_12 TaxID=1249972 RepID=UPI0006465112|nr:S41 family peptidase [Cellulophaga sp. Hel_I_12]